MPRAKRSPVTRKPLPFKRTGVFFGTSAFAVPALHAFADAVDCTLAVTQPDRPAGRGHKLQPTPVKVAALALGIPTLEPERLRDALPALGALAADLFAVASYGKIVPQAILDLPPLGALNVHPSLLPLYRGATPLQSQLRDGVRASGVSIILMDAGMDTGDLVLQERAAIGERETYGELHDRFAELGATLLRRASLAAAAGKLQRIAQAGLAAEADVERTLTHPLRKEDLAIDWSLPAQKIADLVRSLSPQPGARGRLDGEAEMVKILHVRVAHAPEPGQLAIACGDGRYAIVERLVPPSRPPMSGAAYVAAGRFAAARQR
jgi:methionyl-tRNA formyltransferase